MSTCTYGLCTQGVGHITLVQIRFSLRQFGQHAGRVAVECALVSGTESPLNRLSGAVGASPKGSCGELLNLDSMS